MDRRLIVALVVIGFLLLLVSEDLPPRLVLVAWAAFAAGCYALWWWTVGRPAPREPVARPIPRKHQELELNLRDPRTQALQEIERLPVETARLRVERAIGASPYWQVVEQTQEAAPRLRTLTPSQRWFFTQVGGLAAQHGAARICRDEIRAFKWPTSAILPFGNETGAQSQPFTQIGVDFDGNPILAKQGEEVVYVVHGTRSSADRWWCSDYPSLFHWILSAEMRMKT